MFEAFKNRLLLILKELGNILTNTIIPILGIIILIAEILPVPKIYIGYLKTLEYILFYASGTADEIKKEIKERF